MPRIYRTLLDPQGGEGGGAAPAPAATPEPEAKGPDLEKAAQGLIARHGDPTAALRVLLNENFEARDLARSLKAKVPPEGALVLKGDEAVAHRAYAALGAPAEIQAALEAGAAAKAEAESFRRRAHVAKVATAEGMDADVLADLAEGLELALVEQKGKDGKVAPRAVVKGEGDKVTPLEEYAATNWPKYLASLRPGRPAGPAPGTPPRAGNVPAPPVRPEPRQAALKVARF